jgi:proteasome assembly chaperone (PAC2) family protein
VWPLRPFGTVRTVESVSWSDQPRLRDPVLVCAFKGWNDAGEAASSGLDFLAESFEATEVARIDPEDFYDFTAVRPTVRLSEGRSRVIEWPENVFSAAEIPGAEGDLVMLRGVEPSLHWRAFTRQIVDVARRLGVRMVITLGALLADVPHTRPVSITGLATDDDLIERLGFERATYEGPTGIVGVLHAACAEADLASASLWASVPHYVAAAPNPKAALALLRRFEGLAGVAVEASALEDAADDYDRQVSAAVASDPEVKAFVEKLEEAMDEAGDEMPSPERLPSADAIAREFQRFLRQRGPDEGAD